MEVIEALKAFFSFADPNVRFVVAGTFLLGLSSGSIGTFAVLRERSLTGDAVAHAILPGVAMGFLIFGTKHPLALLAGSLVFGWISLICIDLIRRYTKLETDAAIGMVLSVFFGLGIMMLTMIQNSGNSAQSGLNAFIFGQAAAILPSDIIIFSIVSLVVIMVIAILYKEFKVVSFDSGFAASAGLGVKRYEFVLSTLLVLTIVAGLQAVGIVLMAAMLIMPAAAARFWTDHLKYMIVLSALFGGLAGIMGSFISYLAPSLPTGPWMVLSALFFLLISVLFAPKKGFVSRSIQLISNRIEINRENLVKTFYLIDEHAENPGRSRSLDEIQKRRGFQPFILHFCLWQLRRKKLVEKEAGSPSMYRLTDKGRSSAKRFVRRHRLWEVYLTSQLEIDSHHVHDDAESMEHILTDELEERLKTLLGKPEFDPHKSKIPYEEEKDE